MDKCKIIFHQGWNDFFLCIGLVFYNLKKYSEVILLVKNYYKIPCYYLFRNFKIKFEFFDNEEEVNIILNKYPNHKFLPYGGAYCNTKNFDTIGPNAFYFYEAYCIEKIPKNEFIDSFQLDRDLNLELRYYHENTKNIGKKYIVTNEAGFNMDKSKFNQSFPIFNLNFTTNIILETVYLIERAQEIHLNFNYWAIFIYILQKKYNLFTNIPIYYHDYLHPHDGDIFLENHGWIVLN